MVGVGVFLLIANLASKERVIPELMSAGGRSDVESFDTLTSMATGSTQTEVNPTTASIITSILGEQATADQQQVNSAIDTLIFRRIWGLRSSYDGGGRSGQSNHQRPT